MIPDLDKIALDSILYKNPSVIQRFSSDHFSTKVIRYAEGQNDHVKLQWNYQYRWMWREFEEIDLQPLYRWLEDNMPYKQVTYAVILKGNPEGVPPHKDILESIPPEIYQNEPALYRLCLLGNFNEQFYVCRDENKKGIVYPHLPDSTKIFALNCTDFYHGVDVKDDTYWLFVSGEFDDDKHRALLKRSTDKYSEFVIYKDSMYT